ncbi:MAG: DUF3149 domain-containing protein [Methylotenera sp.]|nr:DUF3149 domain-containing protein [Methylotenera sp.]MSP99971.1 DUF3149 domain-containing protein [Methylotenera sp.]
MKLLTDLLSTDYGLQSVAVIAFVLVVAVFFSVYFKSRMDEDDKKSWLEIAA